MSTEDFRRENMRRFIEANGGPTEVAKRLGYSNGSYLVQMTGPNPSRPISERNARDYEQKLGLPQLSLDEVAPATQGTFGEPAFRARYPKSSSSLTVEQVTEIVLAVSTACELDGLNVSLAKFSQLIVLSVGDAAANGGSVREAHINALIQLAK